MRAWLLNDCSGISGLELGEAQLPKAETGEVVVAVRAVGLNPVDYKLAASGHPDWAWPHILGLDVAGEVLKLGSDVEEFQTGQRVLFHGDLRRCGGFADAVAVPEHVLSPIPDAVSYEAAAALPCAGFTAWLALFDRLRIQPEDSILVQGAAGGVGGFAVQLACYAGAKVIGTCSGSKSAYVRKLGAAETIDYHSEDISDRIMELTSGRGVTKVLDAVSSDSADTGLRSLAFGGGIAAVAGRPDMRKLPPYTISPSVHEIALGSAYSYGGRTAQRRLAEIGVELLSLVAQGAVNPLLSSVLEFEQIPQGLRQLATRRAQGKLVARVG